MGGIEDYTDETKDDTSDFFYQKWYIGIRIHKLS